MVAVVVVVAASTGVYLLDARDGVSESPQVAFSADYVRNSTGDVLAVTHDGGDGLDVSALRVTVEGAWSRDARDPRDNEPAVYVGADANAIESAVGDRFESGETVRFDRTYFEEEGGTDIDDTHGDDYLDLDGATVYVVWSASGSDTEYVLWKWEGQNA